MDCIKPYRYISKIAECSSISLAAESLEIQQPALSKYLKKVELELNVELFDRSTNPIRLTDAGKCYLETAQAIIDADNQLHKHISEILNTDFVIHVGISPSRAPYLLPDILNFFYKNNPNTHISITEENTTILVSDLANGNLDLIISLIDEETNNFECIKLFDESVILAVPESCNFTSFEEVISKVNIISSAKGQYMANLLDIMPEHKSLIESQNMVTALPLVREGIGAALLPSYMADYGKEEGIRYISIPEKYSENIHRQIGIFFRKEQFLSSSEKAFIEAAVKATKKEVH